MARKQARPQNHTTLAQALLNAVESRDGFTAAYAGGK